MKTALIIPLHKQAQYWEKKMVAIENLTIKPYIVYIMMDRPSALEYRQVKKQCTRPDLKNIYRVYNVQELPEFVGRPNITPLQSLFLTGHRRNIAINDAINDGCDSFVCIDGDCVPQEDLIKSHMEVHSNNYPIVSVGRRRESKHGYKDQREVVNNLSRYGLFKATSPQIISTIELFKTSAITWSCNIGFNLKVIKLLKYINKRYYGIDEVFHSNFLGTWGGEDGFIGIQSYLSGAKVVLLPDMKSGIKHIEHVRPANKYSGESFTQYLVDQIELFSAMIENDPLTLDFLTNLD
jgi:hypothetical protein